MVTWCLPSDNVQWISPSCRTSKSFRISEKPLFVLVVPWELNRPSDACAIFKEQQESCYSLKHRPATSIKRQGSSPRIWAVSLQGSSLLNCAVLGQWYCMATRKKVVKTSACPALSRCIVKLNLACFAKHKSRGEAALVYNSN